MIVIEDIDHFGITVSELDKAIEFYKELFDFEVVEKLANSQKAYIRVGDIIVGLYESEGYTNQDSSKNRISFYVDEEDFEDAVEELRENNLEIIAGPEDIRKGKSVVFLDPDGNHIELCYPKLKF